ncbi:anti-sigma factor domain-containing protein [Thermosediminibacter litoriperuensis]|uniref:Anti-sigma factor-like protein n=1 Tax=Thermosediminibacter litoriperuensis TaxID=291989 RepID=A0A5S5AY12_9FIRM|nr:anti-sigma factor domain-containing protein [Thermosediminibacter litoriperuensis]TYP58774.1 anti-sigma factor-like protein [Thermosediminibacter litoriperuensis]
MKAVIVDVEGEYIIVVNQRGDFKKIYNMYKGRQIGDEIDIPEITTNYTVFRRIASLAAVFMITVVMAGYGIASFFRPVTYVTMDVNPSVEMSLNRFNRVIDVEGLNDDGARLVGDRTSFRTLPPERVVRMLLFRAREQNLLGPDSVVMFTISNVHDKKMPELEKKLEETARQELKGDGGISIQRNGADEVKVLVQEAPIKKHQEARRMGISQGKLLLYEKLKKESPALDVERVKKMRVREMLEELKAKTGKDRIDGDRRPGPKTPSIPPKEKAEKEKPAKDGSPGEIKDVPANEKERDKEDRREHRGNPSGLKGGDDRDAKHFDSTRGVSSPARGDKKGEKPFRNPRYRTSDSSVKDGGKDVPASTPKNVDYGKKDPPAGKNTKPPATRGN